MSAASRSVSANAADEYGISKADARMMLDQVMHVCMVQCSCVYLPPFFLCSFK